MPNLRDKNPLIQVPISARLYDINTAQVEALGKGTYCLVLNLQKSQEILVGKLGNFYFEKGYYVYVGSAFGPGGIKARVKRHLKRVKPFHWHIDYFRRKAKVESVMAKEGNIRLEHAWAKTSVGITWCHCYSTRVWFIGLQVFKPPDLFSKSIIFWGKYSSSREFISQIFSQILFVFYSVTYLFGKNFFM